MVTSFHQLLKPGVFIFSHLFGRPVVSHQVLWMQCGFLRILWLFHLSPTHHFYISSGCYHLPLWLFKLLLSWWLTSHFPSPFPICICSKHSMLIPKNLRTYVNILSPAFRVPISLRTRTVCIQSCNSVQYTARSNHVILEDLKQTHNTNPQNSMI